VSYEDISSGTRELQTGLAKIKRDLEDRFDDITDGYVRRMYPFATDSEERILALKDRVLVAGRAFNQVKTYYGEGDDRFDPSSTVEVFGRPTSLEFFGIFKTFVTSWDVSRFQRREARTDPLQLCRAQNRSREEARVATEKRQLAERNRAQALSPQMTGMSDQSSIMDDLHARLKMHGTPRAKRHERRRADLPRAPTFGSLDLGDLSLDAYATATRNLLKDLRPGGEGEVEEPTYRRARRSHQQSNLTDELFFMAAQGMSTPRNDEIGLDSERVGEPADAERGEETDDELEHGMLGLSVATNARETNSSEVDAVRPDKGGNAALAPL
jgi:hypothetical protein